MEIESINDAIQNSRVRITDHADEETVDDGLTFADIRGNIFLDIAWRSH